MHEAGNGITAWLDRRFGRYSPLVACVPVYALALAAGWFTAQSFPASQPLLAVLAATVVATLVTFAFSLVLANASAYDPYWSVTPPLFLLFWLAHETAAQPTTARAWLVLGLVSAWALRLTFNCFERWRSMAEEDFRYRDLRARTGRFYVLVNLAGIHLFPTLLVFLACVPMHAVAVSPRPLGLLDLVAILVTGAAIAIEWLADRQLRAFLVRRRPGETLVAGIWNWSRHPNYFGELSFWWGIFLFGLAAGGMTPWMVAGPVAITLLFVFISVPMMETRKRSRHPGYDEATAGIPVLFPWPVRRRNPAGR